MKETIIKCDGCGTSNDVEEYSIYCGTEMDPSGNGYNTTLEYKDWCWNCFKNYVMSSPKPMELLKNIKKQPKKCC